MKHKEMFKYLEKNKDRFDSDDFDDILSEYKLDLYTNNDLSEEETEKDFVEYGKAMGYIIDSL